MWFLLLVIEHDVQIEITGWYALYKPGEESQALFLSLKALFIWKQQTAPVLGKSFAI